MDVPLHLALLIGLGAASALLGAGSLVVAAIRSVSPPPPAPRPWPGTSAVVLDAIPAGSTGRILHHRAGVRAALPARMHDATSAPAGLEVVVVEMVDGVARVTPWS